MKRSVTFPEKIQGKNHWRTTSREVAFALARRAKHLNALAPAVLSRFAKPPHYLPPAREDAAPEPNSITVSLVRISPGYLDDDGLIGGCFVALRDGVATWLGLDDRDARVTFEYLQQGCPVNESACRIVVADLMPGDDEHHIMEGVPTRLAAPVKRAPWGRGGLELEPRPQVPKEAEQRVITFRNAFARLPWDPPGVVTDLPKITIDAPPYIREMAPTSVTRSDVAGRIGPGQIVTLYRHEEDIPVLGGIVWIYRERPPAPAQPHTETEGDRTP